MTARILFVGNTTEFGGLERHLLELAGRLDRAHCTCIILAYGPDFYTERLGDSPGIQVIATNRGDRESFAGYLARFRKLKPSAIVFEKGNLNAFPLPAFLAAKLSGAKNVVVIEQLLPESLPPQVAIAKPWDLLRRAAGHRARTKWLNRLTAAFIDKTICVSSSIRDRLVQDYGFAPERTLAIPNGVNLARFHVEPRHRDRGAAPESLQPVTPPGATIVCVSRLVPRKRVDDVLDAFALVVTRHPTSRLVIVGDGPEHERLRTKMMELGIGSSVSFEGYAEDVRPHLAKGDIFVTASENEGLPFSLIEAMASGLPCIATDIPGHRDVISHGQNGLVVGLKAVPELTEAMEYLLTHDSQRARLAHNGRETVEQHFNTETNMARIASEILAFR